MLPRHLRIAALQCNFQTEDETLAMPARWREIGFDTEQLLHTHADLYSAVYDPARHRDLLARYLENSRREGLRTIIYMNVHILGPSLKEHFDEWGTMDVDGRQQRLYGTYPGCCLNSGWRQYFYSCLESLRDFDIEGFFFDGPMLTDCRCPHCHALFRQATGKDFEEATPEEVRNFRRENVTAFKHELYQKVKSLNPNWISYYNEGLFSGNLTAAELSRNLECNDLVGTEGGFFFYDEPKTVPYWKCSSSAKLAEAVSGGKPTVIFFAGDHKAWGWFMHTDSELKLCYASALANGASIWLGLHHRPDSLNTASGDVIREMVQFDRSHDALYQHTRSLAEVAVFYSFNTAALYPKSAESSDLYGADEHHGKRPGDYYVATHGAFAALEHLSIPFDVVTELNLEVLSRYRAVFAPGAAMLDDASLRALKCYVKQGGFLLADGEFGFFDELDRPRQDWTILQDLTGAKPADNWLDLKRFNYMSVNDPEFPNDNAFGYIPAPRWCYPLTLQEDATAIVKIPAPLAGCYAARPGVPTIPAASHRRLGSGECIYFAGGLFEFYYRFQIHAIRKWFKYLLDKRGLAWRLENARPGISMTIRETQDGQALVHLTNFIGVTRPLDGVVPVEALRLAVPPQYQHALDLKTECELMRGQDGYFQLPALAEYAVFCLSR